MSAERQQVRPQRHDDSQDVSAQEQAESQQRAHKVSATVDGVVDDIEDVLDDAERALKAACGFGEDENVTPKQLEEAAAVVVSENQQKGGQ